MKIQQTSSAIASFIEEQPLVQTLNDKTFACIRENGKVSRNQIQELTGMTARQVSCSVWVLLSKGLIKVNGSIVDSKTNHTIELLEVNFEPHLVFKKVSAREKLEMIRKLCDENVGQVVTQEIVNILSL